MNNFIKLCLSSLAFASFSAVAADPHWEGYYYGISINYVNSSNETSTSFLNDSGTPITGWVNNQFKGALLNSIDSMATTNGSSTNTISFSPVYNALSSTQSHEGATILLGKNVQFDHVVLGGEFKLSLGNFGSQTEQSSDVQARNAMIDYEGATFSYTNYDEVITGLPTSAYISYPSDTNDVDYVQNITNKNSYKMNSLLSLAGRAGIVYKEVMFYGLAGLAGANVNAKTSLTVNESASGVKDEGGTMTYYTGASSYAFSGKSSKNMLGYTLGAGAEWALQENMRLRFEWDYYDLGKITTQGTSSRTGASYKVSQEVTSYNLSLGLIRNF